mgnify:CR=1 FL=1
MQLNHITQNACSQCRREPVAETKDNQHTNGEWNESRRFECGASITYSPNFRVEQVVVACPHSQEETLKTKQRQTAKDRLEKYIMKMDVDNEFKADLWGRVEFIRVN